ncbi:type I-E CRISPR-associated protein Cas6/Cse3/CasE [Deinococcus planocerae]|uniref:type I-E CRISPR-associated protein Cas6/Cse3/CasE n=1 Tax=Deinococcus planocerae TaxID=1737569 RepID=UPI000C7F423C|nr:type I-E CRISPR-associated protein Cas6/Cse3/CasE [Deinococcus planocerae]
MYLSQLVLNGRSRQVQADLRNPYDLHRTLTFAFAPEGEGLPDGERPLWRLDGERPPTLIVQSRHAPDWGQVLARHPGYLETFRTTLLDDAKLNALSRTDVPYRFRLRANPAVTKRAEREGDARTQKPKRYGLYGAREQAGWLVAQGERHGFVPERFEITQAERFRARKGGARVTLSAATFEGELLVRDPGRFRAALRDGLGHGKALGLGLLSLAPTC